MSCLMIVLLLLCIATVVYGHGNTTLLTSVFKYAIEHQIEHKSQLFENILHPMLLAQPVLFNSIIHKILSQNPDFNIGDYILKTATKTILYSSFVFHDKKPNYVVHKVDIWKLLKMFDKDWLFERDLFSNISFDLNGDNKFHVTTNIVSNGFNFKHRQNSTIDKINYSEIPSFVRSISAVYASNNFTNVDLSSFDQSCAIQKLRIYVNNGSIILPDYSFPSSLKILTFIDHGGYTQFMDFKKLLQICSNVETLTIYQKYTKLSYLDEVEHMKKFKHFKRHFDDETVWAVTTKIKQRFENSSIANKQLIVDSISPVVSDTGINSSSTMDDRISIQSESNHEIEIVVQEDDFMEYINRYVVHINHGYITILLCLCFIAIPLIVIFVVNI